jgi:hypothetical protein
MSCNTKLIHIQIIFMHTFLCFDLWTPTASAHGRQADYVSDKTPAVLFNN